MAGVEEGGLSSRLDSYLADAHAIEQQALQLLEAAPKLVEDDALESLFAEHLAETEEHERLVRARLNARGAKPSKLKDAALRIGGVGIGAFFTAQPDTAAKLTGFAYAFEHLEVAAYELLKRVAAPGGRRGNRGLGGPDPGRRARRREGSRRQLGPGDEPESRVDDRAEPPAAALGLLCC